MIEHVRTASVTVPGVGAAGRLVAEFDPEAGMGSGLGLGAAEIGERYRTVNDAEFDALRPVVPLVTVSLIE